MKIKYFNFFTSKTKPINVTYDTYNKESTDITNHSRSQGLNMHLSSIILPFLKVSVSRNQDTNHNQLFTTFSFQNILCQFGFGTDRTMQYRHTAVVGSLLNKWHTVIEKKKYIYTQIESVYHSQLYNLGFKLISPALGLADFVYVINCTRALRNLEMGLEVVSSGGRLGMGVVSRVAHRDSVYGVGIRHFSEIACSFYRRINSLIEVGAELINGKERPWSASAGIRLSNRQSVVKLNVNERLEIGLNWEERLSSKILVNFIGTIEKTGFEYSLGFIYD